MLKTVDYEKLKSAVGTPDRFLAFEDEIWQALFREVDDRKRKVEDVKRAREKRARKKRLKAQRAS
jgi:hypothetical protein